MSPCEQLNLEKSESQPWFGKARPNPQIAADLGSTEQVIKNQLRGIF
jgi:hypothetical protein